MKTKPEIAKAILERRNRMTHVIMPGDINAEIGPDGVSEALKERWLVPDTETGYLCATNDLGKIDEMRKLAEMKPEQYAPEALVVAESHDMAMLHTHRLHEISAPGTGAPSPGLNTIAQPQAPPAQPAAAQPAAPVASAAPTAPPAGSSGGGGEYQIGSPVSVSRQGMSATGMIEKLLPDGRYKLGFAPGQTSIPGDGVFSKNEMSMVPNNASRPAVAAS